MDKSTRLVGGAVACPLLTLGAVLLFFFAYQALEQ